MKIEGNKLHYKLISEGFIFGSIEIRESLKQEILLLSDGRKRVYRPDEDFDYSDDFDLNPNEEPFISLKQELAKTIPESLMKEIDKLSVVPAHVSQKNKALKMHNDILDGIYCQLILWVTDNEDYKGRDFLYGRVGETPKRFKPKSGDFCIANNIDPSFHHGVSKLLDDSKFMTIIFYLFPR